MKLKNWIACLFVALFAASCIQDEALNSEAAIDACKGDDVQFADINSDSKVVTVYVNKGANLSKQKLLFTLAQGASISANETKTGDTGGNYDFGDAPHSRQFTVTSEDGEWKTVYKVEVILAELPASFHFEKLLENANSPFHTFLEFEPGTSQEISKALLWSSGNRGFGLTGMASTPEDYPTVQVNGDFKGKCVKLTTRDTGSFGASVKMPIAAGNLFIGSFDLANALKDAPKATTFGFQFYKHPEILKGYYKYKAGSVYSEGGKPVSGKKDKCDIYAILYEADNNSFMLDGSNSLSSDKLVSVARLSQEKIIESDTWTEFELPFVLKPGKSIDDQKLREGKYKLSIVLSSSIDGAYFKGAVGSTLYVDELELISTEDK